MAHKMGLSVLVLETNRDVYATLTETNGGSTTISRNFSGSSIIGISTDFVTYIPLLSGSQSKTITRIDNSTGSATDSYYYYLIKPGNTINFSAGYASLKVGWSHTTSVAVENMSQSKSISVDRDFKDYTGAFTYVGSPVTWTIPGKGNYSISLYGGGGGDDSTLKGGYGGRVTASKELQKGAVLYLYMGGQGANGTNVAGGWNGGGKSGSVGSSGSGGGGTDIRIGGTGDGYNSASDNRVLVAGGGGGGTYYAKTNGGNGGASGSGNLSNYWKGRDRDAVTNHGNLDGGGGGGGYYGGECGMEFYYSSVGGSGSGIASVGGSNYVGSDWSSSYNSTSTNKGNGKIDASSSL